MSTRNFHVANASKAYVVDYGDDEMMWEEAQNHLGDLIKHLYNDFDKDTYTRSTKELRSYPALSIGTFEFNITYLGLQLDFKVHIFLRAGYYSAANLDYEYEWFVDYSDVYDDITDIIYDIDNDQERYNIDPLAWSFKIKEMNEELTSLQKEAINTVEDILSKVSEPYNCIGTFSNGEAIYEKA